MAIGQFSIDLVPREPVVARFGIVLAELPDGDDEWLWSWQPPTDYPSVIESFARSYPSWSADIRVWGCESGDRVHVIHDDNHVVGIACRIDLFEFSVDFARGLLRLAQHCDCLLLTRRLGLFPPTWEGLLAAVQASDEFQFVRDPHGFLAGLSGEQPAGSQDAVPGASPE